MSPAPTTPTAAPAPDSLSNTQSLTDSLPEAIPRSQPHVPPSSSVPPTDFHNPSSPLTPPSPPLDTFIPPIPLDNNNNPSHPSSPLRTTNTANSQGRDPASPTPPSPTPPGRNFTVYSVLGQTFDVDSRYKILDLVGRGAYGMVVAAKDSHKPITLPDGSTTLPDGSECTQQVAIKKIASVFDHTTFAKRTLREIRLMRLLQHENLLSLQTLMQPLNAHSFQDLYMVSELMETDLSSVIKSSQHLSEEHLQFFMYQLVRGVKFLHTSNVVHRDLKPRNLLVNSNCDLKICDFGLARIDFPNLQWKASVMTDYVATRWYRAPEIIVGWGKYSKSVDIWSIGCILGELINRKPLFTGGDNNDQLELICDLVGYPGESVIAKIRKVGFREYLTEMATKGAIDAGNGGVDIRLSKLKQVFRKKGTNEDAIDIMDKIMRFDPEERLDAEQLLKHPYFAQLHCEEDEPRGVELPMENFKFEQGFASPETIRMEIIQEILIHAKVDERREAKLEKERLLRPPEYARKGGTVSEAGSDVSDVSDVSDASAK